MKEIHFKYYKPEELEAEIKINPINEKNLSLLILNNYIELSYIYSKDHKQKGITMYCGYYDATSKYHIILNKLSPIPEQEITFAHEIVHIYYNCFYTYLDRENRGFVEKIIEREANNILTKYPLSLKSIFQACHEI